jgi:hypothetical protein
MLWVCTLRVATEMNNFWAISAEALRVQFKLRLAEQLWDVEQIFIM